MIVLWRITERCNLACSFCAYDRRLSGTRLEADAATVKRFAKLLGTYRRATGARVLLSWLGGEPLLWPPLFTLSQQLRDTYDLTLSATTNGTTLHRPEARAGILASFSELTVSVDGLSDFHDSVRGWPGGWDRLRSSVRLLVEERERAGIELKLRVNVVLMRDNLAQFGSLCDELAQWGVNEITFNQLGGRDRPEFFPANALRQQDVRALRAQLPALRETLNRRQVRLCGSESYLQRLEYSAGHHPLPVADCQPGEQMLFIDEAGQISPCSFTAAQYGVPLAAVDTLDDLLALPQRFRRQRARAVAAACSDCPSTHVFAKFAV